MRLYDIDRVCFPAPLAYSSEEFIFYLDDPMSVSLVAEWQGRIVGFVIGRIERGGLGHIVTLDVLPEARRRKVATSLMGTLHQGLSLRGATIVFLEVATDNAPALQFYRSLGYERKRVLSRYYRACGDAYLMVRGLQQS